MECETQKCLTERPLKRLIRRVKQAVKPELCSVRFDAPASLGGRAWFLLKATSTGRPASRAFVVKGERPDRTAEHKKKTMKTNTNKNQKQNSEAQSRPEQLSTNTGNRPKINMELRRANRALNTEKLLALLRIEAPQLFELAEVIGKWVWIRFEQKQPDTVTARLAELGFHWNTKRQSWQHPCGNFRLQARPFDPRKKFGSYFAADHKAA